MRTQEQLGYAVWSAHKVESLLNSFCFVIQSPVQDPNYLLYRVLAFLDGFSQALNEIDEGLRLWILFELLQFNLFFNLKFSDKKKNKTKHFLLLIGL